MNLLGLAIQNGDQQSVHYLLKEARIAVPQEPSSTNPAILAAYLGHPNLVKELLDSVPGKKRRHNLSNYMTKKCKSRQPSHMIRPSGFCGAFCNVVVD